MARIVHIALNVAAGGYGQTTAKMA